MRTNTLALLWRDAANQRWIPYFYIMPVRKVGKTPLPLPEFVLPRTTERQRRLAGVLACVSSVLIGTGASSLAAEPQDRTIRAYRDYQAATSEAFLRRVRDVDSWWTADARLRERLEREGVAARPAREDGIVGVPGGLIHHWMGVALIPAAELETVVRASQAYTDYADIYRPIVASRLLERDGDTFRVLLRVKEGAGMISAVLDIWSTVRYGGGTGQAFAVSEATRIRQVEHAGQPEERHLPPARDSGYLWQASTFTRYVARDEGVYVELETLGLSRAFPPMLGWVIEPIARRLGRSSVEESLREFRRAVASRGETTAARLRRDACGRSPSRGCMTGLPW